MNFTTKSRGDINNHIDKKRSAATARDVCKCKMCDKEFHWRNEHVAQIESVSQSTDFEQMLTAVYVESLQQEPETCKHFLKDSEMKKRKHRVPNLAMNTLGPNCFLEKLDTVL